MKAAVVFVGPAGAGKSTLVASYGRWLRENGYSAALVNLDPAADYIPYQPDYDVRRIVYTRDLAKKLGLGPNGALVKAIEILTERVGEVVNELAALDAEYALIDTPGQMEVFVFRDLAPRLMDSLSRVCDRIAALFVVDASLMKSPEDYAFIAIMSVAMQVRLGVDVVPVVNKIDAVDVELVGDVVSDAEKVIEELRGRGIYGDMMARVLEVVWSYAKAASVPRVSAREGRGLEELHRVVHELTCSCGDLT